MMKNISMYGVIGGLVAFLIFILIQNVLHATDVQGFILVGTITVCTIICACTGCLIEYIKK